MDTKFQRQEHGWGCSRNGNKIHVTEALRMTGGAVRMTGEAERGGRSGI